MSRLRLLPVILLGAVVLSGQDLKEFEKKVTEFDLNNGLHFILLERHEAPVVSFVTYVRAGTAQDPPGMAGMARLVARFSYKGSDTFGSRNWQEEKRAMDAADEAYARMENERAKGAKADAGIIASSELIWKTASGAARSYIIPNEYGRLMAENGGSDLSARPKADFTTYTCSLPANRAELWFMLQSQWLGHPVFRDFYAERDALADAGNDDRSLPRLQQALLALAFSVHPYREPELGWPSELRHVRRPQLQEFFDKYYSPGNMVIGIAGDLIPADARRMAEKYFGTLPPRPLPAPNYSVEPPQQGPRSAVIGSAPQGLMLIGYKRPDETSPDDVIFDMLQFILSSGQGGLLQKELVQGKALAQAATAQATYPGGRSPNLFVFLLAPQPGRSLEEVRRGLDDLLLRLMTRPLDAATLSRAKAQARANVARRMDSNLEMAAILPEYYAATGSWRRLFEDVAATDSIRVNDVMRVAARCFTSTNRSLVYTPQQGKPDTVQGLDGGNQ